MNILHLKQKKKELGKNNNFESATVSNKMILVAAIFSGMNSKLTLFCTAPLGTKLRFITPHYQRIRDKSKLLIEIYLYVFTSFPHEKPASTAFSVLCFDWLFHCLDSYDESHSFSRDLTENILTP